VPSSTISKGKPLTLRSDGADDGQAGTPSVLPAGKYDVWPAAGLLVAGAWIEVEQNDVPAVG
jgi:hypothetical protein